jgi:hypothetical protein
MELLSVAELLWRRRILVAVGLVLAVALGSAVGGILPPHSAPATRPAGEALAQVVIDTRVPLVATTAPGADATIVQRSVLLADLMGSNAMAALIARSAGVQPDALSVVGPVLPPVSEFTLLPDGQLPQLAATAAQTAVHTPYVVRLQPNYRVPIVSIGTTAPDVHDAVALAQATIATLKSATVPTNAIARAPMPAPTARSVVKRARSVVKRAAGPDSAGRAAPGSVARAAPSPKQALDVEALGAVSSVGVPATSVHLLRGVEACIALLAVWCAGVVIAIGFARLWRRAIPATGIVS